MKNLKVSIILPVYNEAAFIDQCILSILNQTYQHFEICISDNASSDKTFDIIRSYAEKHKDKFKINRFEKSVHVFINLKMCVEMATGDLVYHFGGDDYLKTNTFLEKAVLPFEDNAVSAHFTRLEYINATSGEFICLFPPESIESFFNLSPEKFCKAFMLETARDDMFVALFRRELFLPRINLIFRSAVESVGWWVVLQIMLIEILKGRKFIFDKQSTCVLIKRVLKKPVGPNGKIQSAAGASANQYDKPWYRIFMSVKYSYQTAMLMPDFKSKIKLLVIQLFCFRRKRSEFPRFLPLAWAILLGAPLWARLYLRTKEAPIYTVIFDKIKLKFFLRD